MPGSNANGLLGYPADARLLILNADDFGMSAPVNQAVVSALQQRPQPTAHSPEARVPWQARDPGSG